MYEVNCKGCDQNYVGQTRRSIRTRFKEYMDHFKYRRIEKFSVAQCAFEYNRTKNIDNLKLIMYVIKHN